MYEGLHGSGVKKPTWRCTRNKCNGVFSVRAKNLFFVYVHNSVRNHSRLDMHIILDLVWHCLLTNETIRQVSFNVGVSTHTVVDWFNLYRETVGKALEHEPKLLRTA